MSRNKVIDIMRALCAIYIIAIFHLNGYYVEGYQFTGNGEIISKMLTIISLGGFTFISGFCLSKYSFYGISDVFEFYKKRLSRFYVLYFLAALTLYLTKYVIGKGWFYNDSQFLLSLFGLSSFYEPIPHTLWYFGMIMFFYLITPLMCFSNKKIVRFGIFILLLGGAFLYDHYFYVDSTLFLYFPFYFLGLLRPESVFKISKKWSFILAGISIILMGAIFVAIKTYGLQLPLEWMIIPPGIYLLISLARLLVSNKYITAFFTFISFASMVAYLFHRHVFGVACVVFSGNSSGPISPIVGLFATIFLFVMSYYIQLLYNQVLNFFTQKKV